ncbi:CAP domain-containing protein [Aeoliella mucimassa]|nr:CAP domain-containing protein [Aeoliella mucimassa]
MAPSACAYADNNDVAQEQQPAEQPTQQLTPSQKRAVRQLVVKFRRARRDQTAQAAVLAEAMQSSPQAVDDIRGMIEAQLTPAVSKYRQDFFKSASGTAAQKFAKADKAEIEKLQTQVNQLRLDPNLSKDQIKQLGDPAMERLAEIALVDRTEVLASNRRLVEERQRLLPAGKLWEVANGYLAKFTPKTGADDASEGDAGTTFDEYLIQEEEIAVRLALPMSDQTRAILKANETLARKLDPEESKCVLSLNLTRILLGLEPLLIDLQLTEAARDHSHDMREHNFFSHESPIPGKKSFTDRAARFGAKASGENIAAGYGTGPSVNLGWFHSPGHHKNMLSDHKTVGVGRDGKHWTQLFGRG